MHSRPTSPTASREAEPRTVGAGAPPEWCGTPHPTTTSVAGLHQRRAGAPDRRLAVVGRLARNPAAAPPTPVERACAGTPHRPRHQRHPPQQPALTLPIGKNASRRQSGMHRCPRQDRRSGQRRRRSRDNGGRQRRAARRSRRRDPLPSLQWVQRPCRSRGSGIPWRRRMRQQAGGDCGQVRRSGDCVASRCTKRGRARAGSGAAETEWRPRPQTPPLHSWAARV